MSEAAQPVLRAVQLVKNYVDAAREIHVLQGLDLMVRAGETLAIVGASGSGKSTLLHLLGGLDEPTAGEVWVSDVALRGASETTRSHLRNRYLGYVYQFHHLMPEFTAQENAAMPLIIRGMARTAALREAATLLSEVGLSARLQHHPGQLSGGERQRVALARALVTRPACVLADEPTGNLDQSTAGEVFDLMVRVNREHRTSFVIVTHDPQLARRVDRRLRLTEGRLQPAD